MDKRKECRKPCCGGTRRRRSVADYFDAGRRRSKSPPLAIEGEARKLNQELTARFSLGLNDGHIAAVSFKASHCVTLVAYCELLAEMVENLSLRDAVRVTARDLVAELPGVPLLKFDRAQLAYSAFLAAVHQAIHNLETKKEQT